MLAAGSVRLARLFFFWLILLLLTMTLAFRLGLAAFSAHFYLFLARLFSALGERLCWLLLRRL